MFQRWRAIKFNVSVCVFCLRLVASQPRGDDLDKDIKLCFWLACCRVCVIQIIRLQGGKNMMLFSRTSSILTLKIKSDMLMRSESASPLTACRQMSS